MIISPLIDDHVITHLILLKLIQLFFFTIKLVRFLIYTFNLPRTSNTALKKSSFSKIEYFQYRFRSRGRAEGHPAFV